MSAPAFLRSCQAIAALKTVAYETWAVIRIMVHGAAVQNCSSSHADFVLLSSDGWLWCCVLEMTPFMLATLWIRLQLGGFRFGPLEVPVLIVRSRPTWKI